MPEPFLSLIIASFIVLSIIAFWLLQKTRKLLRKMADDLQAKYESKGPFDYGKITGRCNNRAFEIKLKYESVVGSKSMYTFISMPFEYRGPSLLIRDGFFKNFPDWNELRISWKAKEVNGVVKYFKLDRAVFPLDEKYRNQIYSIFSGIKTDDGNIFRWSTINISENKITFMRWGVLKRLEVIRDILAKISIIASRIEENPIQID